MSSKLKAALIAATIPAALLVSGCGQSAVSTPDASPRNDTPMPLTTISAGKFFPLSMHDGMYKLTIPAEKAGTPNDVPCILVGQSTGGNTGIGAMSCDWVAAHAPK